MKEAVTLLCLICAGLSGCSIMTTVDPVKGSEVKNVCIKNNPLVHMDGFLPELRSQIEGKGVAPSVYQDAKPEECVYHLEYIANWGWDLAMYLTYTDIKIFRERPAYRQSNLRRPQRGIQAG